VEEGKDKHQEKISLEQDSLGYLEEGITIAVIAHHNTTTTMEDTTADTIMGTTLGTTTDTIMELVDQTLEVMDTTADTTVDPPGVSVTTDLYSKTSMVLHETGKRWCYTTGYGCQDARQSQRFPNNPWSYIACQYQG